MHDPFYEVTLAISETIIRKHRDKDAIGPITTAEVEEFIDDMLANADYGLTGNYAVNTDLVVANDVKVVDVKYRS